MMRTKAIKTLGGFLVSGTVLLAGCGGGTGSAAPTQAKSGSSASAAASGAKGSLTTITVGLTSKTATDWPLYVAQKFGYFQKDGVKVNFIIVGSAAGNAQQLAAGSLDLGETSSTQVIEAIQGGAPVKYVINQVITPPYTLLAQKNIKSIADLKGKTIIVGGVNDITRVFLQAMLKPNGLQPGQYTLTYAGSTSNRFAALKSGSVAAAILFPPFDFVAKSEGYTDLGNVEKYLPSFPFDGFAANDQWAKSHTQALVGFTKAYLQGVQWLYNTANEAEAVTILEAQTNTKATAAKETYQELFPTLHAFSKTGTIDSKSISQVLQALEKLHQIKPPLPAPSKFYDNTYAEQANKQ